MTLLSNLSVWDGFCVQERGRIVFGIWRGSGPVCYDVWLPLGLHIRLMSGVHHYRGDGGTKWLRETLFPCMEWKILYCLPPQGYFSNTCIIGLPERCSSLSASNFSHPAIILIYSFVDHPDEIDLNVSSSSSLYVPEQTKSVFGSAAQTKYVGLTLNMATCK